MYAISCSSLPAVTHVQCDVWVCQTVSYYYYAAFTLDYIEMS